MTCGPIKWFILYRLIINLNLIVEKKNDIRISKNCIGKDKYIKQKIPNGLDE
jgi:hypothetical protein